MFRRTLLTLLLLQVIFCGSISAQAEQPSPAQDSSTEWLKKFDAGDYAGTWESAATIFKAALSSEVWQQTSTVVRTPLGAVQQRSSLSTVQTKTLPGVPDGDYVVMQFNTVFENKAQAVETVVVTLDKDGAWRVAGYFVK